MGMILNGDDQVIVQKTDSALQMVNIPKYHWVWRGHSFVIPLLYQLNNLTATLIQGFYQFIIPVKKNSARGCN